MAPIRADANPEESAIQLRRLRTVITAWRRVPAVQSVRWRHEPACWLVQATGLAVSHSWKRQALHAVVPSEAADTDQPS